MSFKDKHALDTLPKTIAALQAEVDALRTKLDDPGFYARDRSAFERTTATLAKLQQDIAAAEEQWLELEILREELAGAKEPGSVLNEIAGTATSTRHEYARPDIIGRRNARRPSRPKLNGGAPLRSSPIRMPARPP